jgi:tRNA pseudouridine13 synthase
MPMPPVKKAKDVGESESKVNADVTSGEPSITQESTEAELGAEAPAGAVDETHGDHSQQTASTVPWPDSFSTRLNPFLSTEKIEEVKQMFLEGREPPFVSDAGWSGRLAPKANESGTSSSMDIEKNVETTDRGEGKKGNNKRGRDRGGRGGRGGKAVREDRRKVISEARVLLFRVTTLLNYPVPQPIVSKQTRTSFHQTIRELFGGKLDSEIEMRESANNDEGSRIIIRWARRGNGGGGRRGGQQTSFTCRMILTQAPTGGERAPRGTYPPYIHFTLQKTNRDTQDALQYLARTLHVPVKDLSTAGTKDKRGVTAQRVSLRRCAKTAEDVWKLANGVPTRHSVDDAIRERGERGIRIADLTYRKAPLELGMLKGNAFVITLR